jgi:hypothetical protein
MKYKTLAEMYTAGRRDLKVVYTERGYEIHKDGERIEGPWLRRKDAMDFMAVAVMLGLM